MKRLQRQLELPFLGEELPGEHRGGVIVEVVLDGKRPRVRPIDRTGWVRFPEHLRTVGAHYAVEELTPLRGGAWTVRGRIRRVRTGR